MKKMLTALSAAAACSFALAQAPAGLLDRPSAEIDPTRSGGIAQQVAEMERAGQTVLVPQVLPPQAHASDLDRDGVVTQAEWAEWNTRVLGAGPATTPREPARLGPHHPLNPR